MNLRWRRAFEGALIFLIFFIVGGAPAPHVNEAHYLTKAKHYWDASYAPGDLFLDSADPHLVFYWTFGWLTRMVSLPATAWIGRVAAWALLAFAWQRLSHAVTPAAWAAALSAALWVMLIELANFAGEWVVGGVEAKCFAYGLVLLGLAAIAHGNWKTPWIWFGAAAAFHVLVGAWAVLGATFVWLTEKPAARARFASMLPFLVLGGCLSLPGLLPALALERGVDPNVKAEAARIYVFDRLPHHLAPLSLPAAELRMRAVRFGLLIAGFVGLWRVIARTHGSAGASPSQLNRILRFAAFALACNVVGLLIEASLADHPLTAAKILRYYWFRQADVAVSMATALAATYLVVSLLRQVTWRSVAAAAIPIVASGWFLGSIALDRLNDPRPPALARTVRYRDWQDACRWIAENTPSDAVFLIPRSGYTFKWYASRADVANYKDVPQDAASVVEWRQRLMEVFPTVEGVDGEPTTLSLPDLLGADRVRELAKEYGATHVMARAYPPLDLPVVYPRGDDALGSYYTVYRVEVAATESTP
ncbi:MAG TPA: DUF6798 domain-containing protein [Lacipirellula sp.]